MYWGGVLITEKIVIIYVHAYLLFLIMKKDVSHWKKKKGEPKPAGLNFASENILVALIKGSGLTAAYISSLNQLL